MMADDGDALVIAGERLGARLIMGSGSFTHLDRFAEALAASGASMVTVALRRVEHAPGGLYDVIRRAGVRCFPTRPAALRPAMRSARPTWPARRSAPIGSSSR